MLVSHALRYARQSARSISRAEWVNLHCNKRGAALSPTLSTSLSESTRDRANERTS